MRNYEGRDRPGATWQRDFQRPLILILFYFSPIFRTDFSYLVHISNQISFRWFYLLLKIEKSRRVGKSHPVCVSLQGLGLRYLPQPSADNTNLCLNNSSYRTRTHPIIVFLLLLFHNDKQFLKVFSNTIFDQIFLQLFCTKFYFKVLVY